MDIRGRLTRTLVSIAVLGTVGCTPGGGNSVAAGAASPAGAAPSAASPAEAAPSAALSGTDEYLVFYTDGGRQAAERAITAAGGTVRGGDDRLGYLIARLASPERVGADPAVVGVTFDRRVGRTARASAPGPVGTAHAGSGSATRAEPPAEPLADRQWNMKMIGATTTGSYATAKGDREVLVGIIDTGVDGTHPDVAPNFNRALSRNFVTDQPTDINGAELDGPCEVQGCVDPVDADDDGHGTHVASIIGSPLNGLGVAGVAPNVSLVNLRAGTDSGLFFLRPTMDALAYAADIGVDVVNMSFYVDPWMFNCADNPADSVRERLEQRGILEGMRRAIAYARSHGVTLVTAIGNGGIDLGKPDKDMTSPDYPLGAARSRTVDNSCLNLPVELDGVISVSAVGPSGHKAPYSDYGLEQTDLAAPGGDIFDNASALPGEQRKILAAVPQAVARAKGMLDPDGRPQNPAFVRDCAGGQCAYYQYLEGTSMAAPHVTGVAAILISRFGKPGKGGLSMDPAEVERLLYASASRVPCPSPRAHRYDGAVTHLCEGDAARNGFFGHGITDARRAATMSR